MSAASAHAPHTAAFVVTSGGSTVHARLPEANHAGPLVLAVDPFVDIAAPWPVLKALYARADYAVEEALPVGIVEGVDARCLAARLLSGGHDPRLASLRDVIAQARQMQAQEVA